MLNKSATVITIGRSLLGWYILLSMAMDVVVVTVHACHPPSPCASVALHCKSMCECDLPECGCCSACSQCLGHLYTECCHCFGICGAPALNNISSQQIHVHPPRAPTTRAPRKATFSKRAVDVSGESDSHETPAQTLHLLLLAQENANYKAGVLTYGPSPPPSSSSLSSSSNKDHHTAGATFPNIAAHPWRYKAAAFKTSAKSCVVVAYDTCTAELWCASQCSSIGALYWVWFHNGCCQCVGPLNCTSTSWPAMPQCRRCRQGR